MTLIPLGGLSCCLSAAALYLQGRSNGRDAEALKSVLRVNQLKELAQLLDGEGKVLPLIDTLSGRVGSDVPINCEYSGLRVSLWRRLQQHFLKHSDSGSWIHDSALILSMSKEVPWYLDASTSRILFVGARGASGIEFNAASEVFEESGRFLVRGTLDYLQGLKRNSSQGMGIKTSTVRARTDDATAHLATEESPTDEVLRVGAAVKS